MNSIAEILTGNLLNQPVKIHGWVYRTRSSGKITFIVMRDSTGIIQCTAKQDELNGEIYDKLKNLTIESSLELAGTVYKDERSISGYEIKVTDAKIYQRNESFPITKDKSEEFLLDIRHLWVRSQEFTAMLKIRSTIFHAFSDFFYNEGFYEVQGPMMVSTATEGGSTLFKVPFFDQEAYLTQSSQFYLETMIFSLEKVFTIAPSFRAEKSRTRRHLTEYWHAEGEVAWIGNEEMMSIEEKMIDYIVQRCLAENEKEFEILKRDTAPLKLVKSPFPRIKYKDLIEKAQGWGMSLKYMDDLGADEEREITKHFDKPVFVTHYPIELKAFYHRPDPDNPSEILCHDLLAPEGCGEIIGGGERIWELPVLQERMKAMNLDPSAYSWYVDLRKYGSVPHSGFGLGMDRLVWWICGLESIRDAIPYPRTMRRITP